MKFGCCIQRKKIFAASKLQGTIFLSFQALSSPGSQIANLPIFASRAIALGFHVSVSTHIPRENLQLLVIIFRIWKPYGMRNCSADAVRVSVLTRWG